jgi:hypothetical protein
MQHNLCESTGNQMVGVNRMEIKYLSNIRPVEMETR